MHPTTPFFQGRTVILETTMFQNHRFDARFALPIKTREIHNHHMDSTRWNDFRFRDGDIVIATWAKSGTTWTQQIVSQLVFNGAEGVNVPALSPWVDMRIVPQEAIEALEQQTHRRFLKTHLPVDALVFSPKAKYIYVARDGRDAAWSAYNHFVKAKDDLYDAFNYTPGLVGPTIHRPTGTAHDYYREWFEGDGAPLWFFYESIHTWWEFHHLPDSKLLHSNESKRDLPGSIRGIAGFVEIDINEATFPASWSTAPSIPWRPMPSCRHPSAALPERVALRPSSTRALTAADRAPRVRTRAPSMRPAPSPNWATIAPVGSRSVNACTRQRISRQLGRRF
jgi:aryl sulfotransferase